MKTKGRALFFVCSAIFTLLTGCSGGGGSSSGGGGGDTGGSGGGGTQTPTPTISSISPTTVNAGTSATTLTVNGTGFIASTSIQVGGVTESTTYVSSSQVTAVVPATQMVSGGQLSVVAVNGTLSSTTSTSLQVTNPAPTITSLSPSTLFAGSTSPTVAVTGTGFVPTTTIQVNGAARTTTYVNATQVNAALTTADLAAAGTLSFTAVNSAPGGGTSSAATIAVSNPAPSTTSFSPTYVVAGSGSTTVTITGANFVAASKVLVNGTAVPSTFVSSTQLTFSAASLNTAQLASVVVSNPTPGGGNSPARTLYILVQTTAPVITQVSPTQVYVGGSATSINVYGTNLVQQVATNNYFVTGTILWNGTPLSTTGFISGVTQMLIATVPASQLTATGTATITVSSIAATPSTSNALTISIANPPPPTLTSIYPSSGALNTSANLSLNGTGFSPNSTVQVNGTTIASKYVSSTQMTATLPANLTGLPGNLNITVTTPAPGGGVTSALPYTVYLNIVSNDMVSSPGDGLLYVSSPQTANLGLANMILGIDPTTGNIVRKIQVGSNPNKLALSSDGTQLFVGLDGANAVAQVKLSTGEVISQFPLQTISQYGNNVYTALGLAAVPGLPNSVAVYASSSVITIYDSGVPRTNTSSAVGYNSGAICFGASASTLYVVNGGIKVLTVGPTGFTASNNLNNSVGGNWCQYDNGQIYLNSGAVVNATTGNLSGTFYANQTTAASGPIVSDSTLNRAFIVTNSTSTPSAVFGFDESTYNPVGNIPFNLNSYLYNSGRIVRWGQSGIAVDALSQIYIFQSPVVKDLSPSPADLSISLNAPSTGTTGSAMTFVATVKNLGPNTAVGATLAESLDSSLIVNSVTAGQGSCSTGVTFSCDLGDLANGASVNVTVSVTPTTAATVGGTAALTSTSYDPSFSNNQATASSTITGAYYSMVPSISTISPALVQAGSSTFTLTVNGIGFNSGSVINVGGTALSTNYLSATQLAASIDSSLVAKYGWLPVTVSNATPGGGTSQVAPLTIFAAITIPANSILVDPYSQQIYASVPSAATTVAGNSIVAIDPFTATVGTPILVGSEPGPIAETSDGNYLFIGLTGSKSLVQFDLLQKQVLATVPLSITQFGGTSAVTPYGLATMPGVDTSLAINMQSGYGSIGIFDISGNTGAFRANLGAGSTAVFPDATHLYTNNSGLSRYTVGPTGLTQLDSTSMNGFGNGLSLANGIAFGGQGGIVYATANPPFPLGILPPVDFYQSGGSPFALGVLPDLSLQKDFMMLGNAAGTWAYGVARYNNNTYAPETWLSLPTQTTLCCSLAPWTMARFGADGIALLSPPGTYQSPTTFFFVLIRGPFVAPGLLSPFRPATLVSSSATTISHGTGNTMLTLTVSDIVPGVAANWNGSYRTTTILDGTHLSVAIPASDLANSGSASLTVVNPGVGASNALTITIN